MNQNVSSKKKSCEYVGWSISYISWSLCLFGSIHLGFFRILPGLVTYMNSSSTWTRAMMVVSPGRNSAQEWRSVTLRMEGPNHVKSRKINIKSYWTKPVYSTLYLYIILHIWWTSKHTNRKTHHQRKFSAEPGALKAWDWAFSRPSRKRVQDETSMTSDADAAATLWNAVICKCANKLYR